MPETGQASGPDSKPSGSLSLTVKLSNSLKQKILDWLRPETSREVEEPRSFKEVFKQERDSLRASRRGLSSGDLVGLALSGGGIRSATFNLGVLQALARLGVLKKIDYLSTVSGGGYIGSWLQSWIHRSKPDSPEDTRFDVVNEKLSPEFNGGMGPPEIAFLREYSNYLTPRVGVLSQDSWTVLATYIRNTALNLLVLVLAAMAVLMVPHLLVALLEVVQFPKGLLLFGVALVVASILVSLLDIDKSGGEEVKTWAPSIIVALLMAATVFSFWLYHREDTGLVPWIDNNKLLGWPLIAAASYSLIWWLATELAARVNGRSRGKWGPLWAMFGGGLGGYLLAELEPRLSHCSACSKAVVAIGPALISSIFIVSGIVHVGLAGKGFRAEDREWWSRLGGGLALKSILFTGLLCLGLYADEINDLARDGLAWSIASLSGMLAGGDPGPAGTNTWAQGMLLLGWLLITLLGVRAGKGDRQGGRFNGAIMAVAPLVFIGGFAILVSRATRWTLATGLIDLVSKKTLWGTLVLMVLLGAAACCLSWRLGSNLFSMHAMYRNRLVRCYLGATRSVRKPNPFTGFDRLDDLKLRCLANARPYPLINTTLNLLAGSKLAWQKRKAASFVFSPLYCGYEIDPSPSNTRKRGLLDRGYRSTKDYAGSPTLGTAVGISGAAASPNMGYHSKPAMTVLMTMLNIRLGWWLGNTRHSKTWKLRGPVIGLSSLLNELMGRTSDDAKYVYLSDGGHFENLGIYELVRRRCRLIIACDAEQDGDFQFNGLGNAIEKCRTDLGTNIDIDTGQLSNRDSRGFSEWSCAVGTIRYPKTQGGSDSGTLVYLKSSLTGKEPADVLKYAATHPRFPHEPTSDQWFDETQFESYRALGEHIGESVFKPVSDRLGTTEELCIDLMHQWYPRSETVKTHFTKHALELNGIFRMLNGDRDLRFLSEQIYPEWRSLMQGAADPPKPGWLPENPDHRRAGFYACNQMIQLMEMVYLDLDLEAQWDQPDMRGWMNLFKHWTWSSMFRATWTICASSYGARFQRFCEQRLELKLGEVVVVKDEGMEKDGELNFEERRILRKRGLKDSKNCLYLLRIRLKDYTSGEEKEGPPLELTIGFAVAQKDELLYFRIQDHLRRQGLGRRALWALIETHGRFILGDRGSAVDDSRGFVKLFNSVIQKKKGGAKS